MVQFNKGEYVLILSRLSEKFGNDFSVEEIKDLSTQYPRAFKVLMKDKKEIIISKIADINGS